MCSTLLPIWVAWVSSSLITLSLCITQWSVSTCLRRPGSVSLKGVLFIDVYRENLISNTFVFKADFLLLFVSCSAWFMFHCCRFFYASSACIYPEFKQLETSNVSLKESDAWPAEVRVFCGLAVVIPRFKNWGLVQYYQNEAEIWFCYLFVSRKMLMIWRSLLPKSCASITPKISELNAELECSITFMVLLEPGKVTSQLTAVIFAAW